MCKLNNLHNQPYFGKHSIDSFKLHIPVSKITIIDKAIYNNLEIINTDTGEILKSDMYKVRQAGKEIDNCGNKIKYNTIENGITFKLATCIFPKTNKEYLVIMINSKVLMDKYFAGITKETSKLIYDFIINANIIEFSYKDFLNGYLTDIDIKIDLFIPVNEFVNMIKTVHKNIIPIQEIAIENPTNTKKHKALYLNDRTNKHTYKYPFTKFYSKGIELKYNSNEFYQSYLLEANNIDYLENIQRIETTIKNKKQMEKVMPKEFINSLDNFLNLTQNEYIEIMKKQLSNYFDINKPIIRTDGKNINGKNLNITDFLATKLIGIYMDKKYTYNQIENSIIECNIEMDKQTKYRYKKKLKQVYDLYFKDTPQAKENEKNRKELLKVNELIGIDLF